MIDLLRVAGERIVVPTTVAQEIAQRGGDDAAVQNLRDLEWLEVVVGEPIPAQLKTSSLDPGELAVLPWALAHPDTAVILDDRAARRRALALGLRLHGTLSIILEAKHRGMITHARPVVERVRRAGLYLSDRLVVESLRLAGE